MIIEIQGVNFVNKGAELMLHATLQQIKSWDDDNIAAVRPVLMRSKFEKMAELGLHQLAWTDIERPKLSFLTPLTDKSANLIPEKYRRLFGIVTYSEVNAVLDASGFAFSDQWGAKRSENLLRFSKKWKSQGKKVILLPQAFGPFENSDVKNAFKQALEYVDLVFARDNISYEHLLNLNGKSSNIKMAPDFTNLVSGKLPDYFDTKIKRPCIIPNCRMLDKTSETERENYLPFLKTCVDYFLAQGMEPFMLVHDTSGDFDLATKLQQETEGKVSIVNETNPLYIKGIIGSSHVVVGSRFHGLISSLSQGVPALCAGWSHKYNMLFDDYEFSEFLVSPSLSKDKIVQKLEALIQEPYYSKHVEALVAKSLVLKGKTKEMWTEVRDLLYS